MDKRFIITVCCLLGLAIVFQACKKGSDEEEDEVEELWINGQPVNLYDLENDISLLGFDIAAF